MHIIYTCTCTIRLRGSPVLYCKSVADSWCIAETRVLDNRSAQVLMGGVYNCMLRFGSDGRVREYSNAGYRTVAGLSRAKEVTMLTFVGMC